tara:strand:+ start:3987 stop:4436 length:450 start_codon:yes stop_codon:yes gene_type:complete
MELLKKTPQMDLSLIADALHEIAVDLKKHTNVKQEMNVEEDDGSPMYPATQEEFEEEILKQEAKLETEEILNKIETLLKTIIFTKAIGSKGDIYEIDIEKMTCTCPAWIYNPHRQFICKHLKKALKYKADYEKNFQYPKLSELHKKEDY